MGRGPVLLLVHGTAAATHSWRDLAPLLARRFTVVAPDLPGHGFSGSPGRGGLSLPGMAGALRALLDALRLEPAVEHMLQLMREGLATEISDFDYDRLFAELRAGKTLAEIAEAQGVEMEAVHEALQAARGEAMRQAIEQAVEDGKMSQEQADWMLEGLEQGYAPMGMGRGFGRGRGPGGCPCAEPENE